MGYYQGDYYSGDYYSGDPGFMGLIGKFGRSALQLGAGAVPGVGKVIAGARAILAKHPVISAAAGAGAIGAGGAIMTTRPTGGMVMPGGARMGGAGGSFAGAPGLRGYHMSKPRRVNPASGVPHMVKNRRMRVTNPRALRRAIRRATGFARMARKVLHFTSPRAPRGRAIFKRKRARR